MKFIVLSLVAISLIVGCQQAPEKSDVVFEPPPSNSVNQRNNLESSPIRRIDFHNFTFPWTKTFGNGEKSFTLKNRTSDLSDERQLFVSNLISYVTIADHLGEQALVVIGIGDGNATYHMLYVYAVDKGKPRLLESFEFGSENVYLRTAFAARGELVIERHLQQDSDPECCPSIIEISYYRWQKNRFIQQGEPQKIANGYVERLKQNHEN